MLSMVASPIGAPEIARISLGDCPWLADTCAAVHISCSPEDFLTLHPISTPKAVKWVGGSLVYARGIGNVKMKVARGLVLELKTSRLISVGCLLNSLNYRAVFAPSSLQIRNSADAIIATGSMIPWKFIHKPDCSQVSVYHTFTATRLPTLETIHRHLGHVGIQMNLRQLHE